MTTITTPFGRGTVSLGQIALQAGLRQTLEEAGRAGSNRPAAVEKWRLFRTLTEIRERLGVSDRTLGVLNALLTFHPEVALSLPGEGEGAHLDLVVFPSNRALSLRAHGMAEKTLRRHLAALVEAGLIVRRDSPNGKRYARKAEEAGADRFADAFGFDLLPLVVRAPEFEAMAEDLRRRARLRQALRERISLHRRDLAKLIALGLDAGLPGDWEGYRQRFLTLLTPLRRIGGDAALEGLAAELERLRLEVLKALEGHAEDIKMTGNDGPTDRHQSNSKSQSDPDLEPASKEDGGEIGPVAETTAPADGAPERKSYPLGMVLDACPDVKSFAPMGRIASWPDFLETVRIVRPMLGISPDAFAAARETLGEIEAHVVVAAILQRFEHSSEAETVRLPDGKSEIQVNGSPAIRSAGGYLRALTDTARAGDFALGPVLMALIGQRLKRRRAKADGVSA